MCLFFLQTKGCQKWYIDSVKQGPGLAIHVKADYLLIDTFDKTLRLGLLGYHSSRSIRRFVEKCHNRNLEAWLVGSIAKDELPRLWNARVDVICIRGAVRKKGSGPGRLGEVNAKLANELADTMLTQ